MLAVHLDNLPFLLFVFVALLFQLLARAAAKASKDRKKPTSQPRTPPPTPPVQPKTDEQRIREFLEALGQPPTSKAPPPVIPRPTYQKPIVASPIPPELPRHVRLPGQIPSNPQKKTFKPRVAEAPVFEVHKGASAVELPPVIRTAAEAYPIATPQLSKPDQTESTIPGLLQSTSGLRHAIILREIFGPPRSLQPLDPVRSV
jgi:hypothetical protein